MKPRTHTCAATGCQHLIAMHLLMCMDHWRMVPVVYRREVLATYRVMGRGDWQARLDARTDYLKAVDNAVAALATKQTKKNDDCAAVMGDLFTLSPSKLHSQLSKEEHGNTTTQGRQPT